MMAVYFRIIINKFAYTIACASVFIGSIDQFFLHNATHYNMYLYLLKHFCRTCESKNKYPAI